MKFATINGKLINIWLQWVENSLVVVIVQLTFNRLQLVYPGIKSMRLNKYDHCPTIN